MILLSAAFGCSPESKSKKNAAPAVRREVVAKTTLFSTIADKEEFEIYNPAIHAKTFFEAVVNEEGRGVAYVAKKGDKTYVVHNGISGPSHDLIFNLAISPDGKRVAYVAQEKDGRQRMILDNKDGQPFDDVGRPVFSPDSKHIAYKIINKEKLFVVIDDRISSEYKVYNGNPVFNADSSRVAYSEGADGVRRSRLVITDLEFRKVVIRENSGDYLILNDDKTRLATINEVNNKRRVLDISFTVPPVVQEGQLYDLVDKLTFNSNTDSLSYVAQKDGVTFEVLKGRELPVPPDTHMVEPIVARDQQEVVAIMAESPEEGALQALSVNGRIEKYYGMIAHLTFSRDGSMHAYAGKVGERFALVVNGKEGPIYDMIVAPMFSPDGKFIVYRGRNAGKRFVVVADSSGKTLRKHPVYDMVFDTVFTNDGKSVAYGVKDGLKLIWKVEKLQKN